MKYSLLIGTVLMAHTAFATAIAEPITIQNIDSKLNSVVLKKESKDDLRKFVKTCTSKDWAGCHMAWYDLHLNGLRYVTITEDGFTFNSWQFPNNEDATNIYDFVINGLDHVSNKAYWDLGIEPVRPYQEVLSYVPVRYARFDKTTKQAALDIIQANLGTYDIPFNVTTEFKNARAEWFRVLALTFMVRKDTTNTYKTLEELKKYGKMTENTQLYNDLVLATNLYFKKTGVLK